MNDIILPKGTSDEIAINAMNVLYSHLLLHPAKYLTCIWSSDGQSIDTALQYGGFFGYFRLFLKTEDSMKVRSNT